MNQLFFIPGELGSVRVPIELATEIIRDEISWSLYASLSST